MYACMHVRIRTYVRINIHAIYIPTYTYIHIIHNIYGHELHTPVPHAVFSGGLRQTERARARANERERERGGGGGCTVERESERERERERDRLLVGWGAVCRNIRAKMTAGWRFFFF
jgi:hypothetical protein